MQKDKSQVVFPGDHLSFSEEYLPGENTTEVRNKIVSSSFGTSKKDDLRLIISVDNGIEKIRPHVGDIVYGQVFKGDSKQFSILIVGISIKNKLLHFNGEGKVHVFQDHRSRNAEAKQLMIGDLVRCKISRIGQFLELNINGKDLGVLKTRCSNCREVLQLKDDSLYCTNCMSNETRKFASDYGKPVIMEEEK